MQEKNYESKMYSKIESLFYDFYFQTNLHNKFIVRFVTKTVI